MGTLKAGAKVVIIETIAPLNDRERQNHPLDRLTKRELSVLSLMAEGRSNGAIADQLFLSEKTVETHVRSTFTKLNLLPTSDDHRRVLAVLMYLRFKSASTDAELWQRGLETRIEVSPTLVSV